MEKQNPSSFEAEFNRLSFLASIATGTTEPGTTKTQNTFESYSNATLKPQNILQSAAPQKQQEQYSYNGKDINTTTTVTPIFANGFSNHTSQAPTKNDIDLQKLTNILLNPKSENTVQSIVVNSQANNTQQVRTFTNTEHSTAAAPRIQQYTPTRTVVTQVVSSSHPYLTVHSGLLGNNKSAAFTQQQLQRLAGTVKMQSTTNSSSQNSTNYQTVNSPLVISSTQPRMQTVVTNNGQTILLPANFAGMYCMHVVKLTL